MELFQFMKNKRNIILYIIFFVIFLVSAIIVNNTIQKDSQDRQKLFVERSNHMEDILNSDMKIWSEYYRQLLTDLAADKEISTLFAHQEREKLYDLMYSIYVDLQEAEPALEIFHFHNADSTSFLRMHNKNKFGDNLSKIRPLIESVHTTHKPINGYESGRYGGSLRVVVPVFYEERYIGALEIGLNPTVITESLESSDSNVHFQFVLHKNSIKKLSDKNLTLTIDSNYAVMTLNKFFTLEFLKKVLHSDDVVLLKQENKEFYTSKVTTIYDYENKILGYIVGAYDFTLENQRYSINLVQLILMIGMAIVVFLALILFSTRKNS